MASEVQIYRNLGESIRKNRPGGIPLQFMDNAHHSEFNRLY